MKILTTNAGSSSLKISLFETQKKEPVLKAKIHIDGIKNKNCLVIFESETHEFNQAIEIINHCEAFEIALFTLLESGCIKDLKEIDAVGHRIVHGGEYFKKSTVINKKEEKYIEKLIPLAPLHNPVNLESLKAAKHFLKKIPHIGVFDTAFHQNIPEENFLYAIPRKYYEKQKIRRYGFHGLNHKFVSQTASKILKNDKAKIISCHLGNGSSICASIGGLSVDTSMGFTPLEGVIMGTRSGSIDPGIIFYLLKEEKIPAKKLYKILNEESGLKALSGISQDMREIYAASLANDPRAIQTIEILSDSIAKIIGAYMTVLNGVDAIVFTGGLGEKAFYVREKVINRLAFAGIQIDKTKNKKHDLEIQKKDSKAKIFVMESDEQKEIALETLKILESK
ncbi:MAG: acetate/propionate family kinase [Candidatus Gracilibacteria bacterium]|jgi:acetate kinase|nr:acetate/propionate family kinase [Candidatus Gracilibacteria bacterium]